MIRKKIIKILFSFIAGIIAGVVGTAFYEIFGKPALPSYYMDVIDSETIKRIAQALMDMRASLEKTQPIKVR